MIIFIWLLYFVIAATYIAVCCFIIYHLKKYSSNSPLNKTFLPVFAIISLMLLLSNLLLFSSIDWNKLISKLRF